jgi:thiol-disulfide isomerase/thioredoxin
MGKLTLAMKKIVIMMLFLLGASSVSAALKTNDVAPTFSLRDGAGKDFYLSDIVSATAKEKVNGVIVSFFASWCVPCRQELPLINSLVDELKGKGIEVVLVNVKEDPGAINALLSELKVNKPVVLSDRYGRVSEKYQVRFLPTTFFIGSDGKIKDIIFGPIEGEKELRKSAGRLVN